MTTTAYRESAAYAQIVARCWADDNFRNQFINNPKQVLEQHGWEIPENVEVQVQQNSSSGITLNLPLPDKPSGLDGSKLEPLMTLFGCCTT